MTTEKQYWEVLIYFWLHFNTTLENLHFKTKYLNHFLAHFAFSPNSKLPRTSGGSPSKAYLWLGGGQSEPYSWTCMPKKHKSTPSISSKAKRALVRYGKDSAISPLSTNLYNSDWREKPHLIQIRIINNNHAWTTVDPREEKGTLLHTLLSCLVWLPRFCQKHELPEQWPLLTQGDFVASEIHSHDSPERCLAW